MMVAGNAGDSLASQALIWAPALYIVGPGSDECAIGSTCYRNYA